MKRFFKKCEEFSICSEIAKSGDYFDASGMVMATQADPIEEDAEE